MTRTTLTRRAVSLALRLLARRRVTGLENIPRQGPCLLVFNQMSVFDTPLLSVMVPREDVTGLVARDYRRNPIYRVLIEWGGGMWIRRNSGDRAALRAGLGALRRGCALGISPEGRRSPTGALVPGKPGPAFLARRSGAPIVPVAFANTENMAASLKRLQRPVIEIRVGPPFALPPAQGATPKERLRDDTDRIMCRIAALLPPRYHGAYADHPYLRSCP
ncbi:MAG TPA: lysophospholipid acyltransferase family protein [Vicinamibacteria bacterium]